MHVPLIVSGSALGAVPGTRVSRPVSVSQLAPTILAWAGLSADELPEVTLPTLLDERGPDSVYIEGLYPSTRVVTRRRADWSTGITS
jgi:arylsulfatase A-like enzyme